jgi:hypothetical protein
MMRIVCLLLFLALFSQAKESNVIISPKTTHIVELGSNCLFHLHIRSDSAISVSVKNIDEFNDVVFLNTIEVTIHPILVSTNRTILLLMKNSNILSTRVCIQYECESMVPLANTNDLFRYEVIVSSIIDYLLFSLVILTIAFPVWLWFTRRKEDE